MVSALDVAKERFCVIVTRSASHLERWVMCAFTKMANRVNTMDVKTTYPIHVKVAEGPEQEGLLIYQDVFTRIGKAHNHLLTKQ